jgi:flagellin FlaB
MCFSIARDQRGITGLETAIVLIAFVVVASVFAFAVLSTGLLSSEKSKQTVLSALEETGSTVALRGNVVAHASTSPQVINYITLQVSNASRTGRGVDLSSDALIVSYTDKNNRVGSFMFTSTPPTASTAGWGSEWLSGSGPLLQPGERVQITVNLTELNIRLGIATEFTIEIKPSAGAVLAVSRRTPNEFTPVLDLQ